MNRAWNVTAVMRLVRGNLSDFLAIFFSLILAVACQNVEEMKLRSLTGGGASSSNGSSTAAGPVGTPPILSNPGDFVFPATQVTWGGTVNANVDDISSGPATDVGMTYACTFNQLPGSPAITPCAQLPGLVSFNGVSGVLAWTPNEAAFGPYEIVFSGTNLAGLTDTEAMLVNVQPGYVLPNLILDLDAQFASLTGPGTDGTTTQWFNLVGGPHGALLGSANGTGSAGWRGSGSFSSPHNMTFDSSGSVDFSALLNTLTDQSWSSWIFPMNPLQLNKVVFGNGGNSGDGFVLKQSERYPSMIEYHVGKTRYDQIVLASAPVGYWRLNDAGPLTAIDAVGAHNGVYASMSGFGAPGPIDSSADGAAIFSQGLGSSVNIGNAAVFDFPAASFTLEAWVRINGGYPLNGARVIAKEDTGDPDLPGYSIYFDAVGGNRFCMNRRDPVGLIVFTCGPKNVPRGVWLHLVANYDGTNINFFQDGAFSSFVASASGIPSSGNLRIGASDAGGNINAEIAQVAVYNTVLSNAVIARHYVAGIPPHYAGRILNLQPAAYWRLNDHKGDTAIKDASTNLINMMSTGTQLFQIPGPLGPNGGGGSVNEGDGDTAMQVPGGSGPIGNRINGGSIDITGTALSFAVWIHPVNFATDEVIFGSSDGAGPANRQFILRLVAGTGLAQLEISNGGAVAFTSSTAAVSLGSWSHLGVTYDGTRACYYFNGVLDSCPIMGLSIVSHGGNIHIGALDAGGAESFVGKLDELAVFDKVLTEGQIKALAQGKRHYCRSRQNVVASDWTHLSSRLQTGVNVAELFENGRVICRIPVDPTFSVSGSTDFRIGADALGTQGWNGAIADYRHYNANVPAVLTQNFNTTVDRYRQRPMNGISMNNLLYMLDAPNNIGGKAYPSGCSPGSSPWRELSLSGVDAVLRSMTCAGNGWATTWYERLLYNGSGSHVQIETLDLVPASGTAVFWLSTVNTGVNMTLLTDQLDPSSNFFRHKIWISAGGGELNVDEAAGFATQTTVPITWNGTKVYHVALTWSPAGRFAFVNGVQIGGAMGGGGAFSFNGTGNILLGLSPSAGPSEPFIGSIYHFSLYNSAFNATQVSTHCKALQPRYAADMTTLCP